MKTTLSARIDAELKQRLCDLAKKENRNLSNYIEIMARKHIEQVEKQPGRKSRKGVRMNSILIDPKAS